MLISVAVAALLVIGGGGWWYQDQQAKEQTAQAAERQRLAEEARAKLEAEATAKQKNNLIAARYEISEGGNAVKDIVTGLTWARCSVGQKWDGQTCHGEVRELTFPNAQTLNNTQWRLPTSLELMSLIQCVNGNTPMDSNGWCKYPIIKGKININLIAFPGVKSNRHGDITYFTSESDGRSVTVYEFASENGSLQGHLTDGYPVKAQVRLVKNKM